MNNLAFMRILTNIDNSIYTYSNYLLNTNTALKSFIDLHPKWRI